MKSSVGVSLRMLTSGVNVFSKAIAFARFSSGGVAGCADCVDVSDIDCVDVSVVGCIDGCATVGTTDVIISPGSTCAGVDWCCE